MAAPPPQPLFGSHSGKLNFGKKPSAAETLQSDPSFTFLATQNRKQKREKKKRQRKKKGERGEKKNYPHSRKLTAFF